MDKKQLSFKDTYLKGTILVDPIIVKKYAFLLGEFIMNFSNVEDKIDMFIEVAIDKKVPGSFPKFITSKLTMNEKIQLFLEQHSYMKSELSAHNKYELLIEIHNKLLLLNKFRNILAHATWSITDGDYIKSRSIAETSEGHLGVLFTKITPNDIIYKIKLCKELISNLQEFVDRHSEMDNTTQ